MGFRERGAVCFVFDCAKGHGSYLPNQGSNPFPLHCNHGVQPLDFQGSSKSVLKVTAYLQEQTRSTHPKIHISVHEIYPRATKILKQDFCCFSCTPMGRSSCTSCSLEKQHPHSEDHYPRLPQLGQLTVYSHVTCEPCFPKTLNTV